MLDRIQSEDDMVAFQTELDSPVEFQWCGLILAADDTFVDSRVRKEDKGIVMKPRESAPLPFNAMLEDG